MTTYSFTKGIWKQTVEPFLIPTGCDFMTDEDLQKRVIKENDGIYYYETDPNDENGGLLKKRVAEK
ncbi:hypothetical protein NAT51_08130 [Flavobacterium amniphilum]|uniref:hypothetical protein n=1 Tax=Flavobacterium amniphilum TaxID=1834035 RepID=UPI002029CB64|nr:hypothetical protein [Flavobacterium amniphilum]MCL9805486.1 hypothetical protein [Flavobacterium amniphilum]